MDALRWTLLTVGVLVLVGIYAWGKREQLLAWWHGNRAESLPRFDEEGDDLSDELQRLRDLMEAEKDDRPPRRTHTDRDAEQLDYDYGIEVSAPRPAGRRNSEVATDTDDPREARDPLLEAAAAKAARSAPGVPISTPRTASAAIEVGARRREVSVAVPEVRTPDADTPSPAHDFTVGGESVSAPRVRAATPAQPQPQPRATVEAPEPTPGPVPDPASVPAPTAAPDSAHDALDQAPLAVDQAEPQSSSAPERETAPAPISVAGSGSEPTRPEQVRLDLGDEPIASPPPVRRLDTVIVDGEVFDTRHGAASPSPAPAGGGGVGGDHPGVGKGADAERPGPGLSETGARVMGRVMGWVQGLTDAARERIPKREEPPVQTTPELILVVHVMAREGSHFTGEEIRLALQAHKLTLGANGLYEVLPRHRATTTPVICVANMMQPGVLSDDELVDLQTPGLSLFLRLPGPVEGMEALEVLLLTAQAIARELHGEMRDQARNRLTKQTITHMKEQVLEHARRMQIALSRGR